MNYPERIHYPVEEGISGARDRFLCHWRESVKNGL